MVSTGQCRRLKLFRLVAEKRRFPWKWVLLLGVFLAAGVYFGGGLWGPGGGRFREKLEAAKTFAQDTPAALRAKIESLRELADEEKEKVEEDVKSEARERAQRLAEVLDAWAEDRYLAAKDRVDGFLAQGKVAEARAELESVPREYWSTKFGPEFESLKKKIP